MAALLLLLAGLAIAALLVRPVPPAAPLVIAIEQPQPANGGAGVLFLIVLALFVLASLLV